MPFTYAIADLHGRYDLLEKAYLAIQRDANARVEGGWFGQNYKIVHLGDYVDRGPESRRIIEFLMTAQAQEPHGPRRIVLKGNHEDIMWQACRRPALMDWWLQNGGGATLMSYGQHEGENANPLVIPLEHLTWADSLPLMHVDQHRVFVHAGVDPDVALDRQAEILSRHGHLDIYWKIYGFNDERGHGDRHVVHGHHKHEDGPKVVSGRTNLDTFAWYTGRLVVGVFDDEKPGGALDYIEVIGPSAEALQAA